MVLHRAVAPKPAAEAPSRRSAAFWQLWLAAALLPLIAFAIGAALSWRQVQAETEARISRTVQMLEEHALRAFETQEAVLTAVASAADGLSWDEIASSEALHALLRSLDRRTSALSGIGLVRPDGMMVATASAFPTRPVDVSDREYFRANRDGHAPLRNAFVGEVVVSRPRDTPVFSMSRARLDATGGFDGVIVTAFDPDYFAGFYRQVEESPGDAVVLTRLDAKLLARSPPVTDWRVAFEGPLTDLARGPGRGVLRHASAVDGRHRIYAVRRLRDYPVAVAYGLDMAVPRAAWLRQLATIGAISGLAAALLLGLTARAARAVRREAAAADRVRVEAERRAEAEAARADAEAALRHGQRLEALGQVVAGVAHDFRNTVHAVQGGARLIRQALEAGDTDRAARAAALVADAAGRGEALTERMLAVARPGGGTARVIRGPARALREACALLRPTLGPGIRLDCAVPEDLPPVVRGDPAELEAAVINLVVNARDAMPGGGDLTVSARAQIVGPGAPGPAQLPPGRYLRLSIADTGTGMDAATLERATEAFFTTKAPGRGTGLGLATARAFAEAAGGALLIDSSQGRGTTVTLLLPEAAEGAGGPAAVTPPPGAPVLPG